MHVDFNFYWFKTPNSSLVSLFLSNVWSQLRRVIDAVLVFQLSPEHDRTEDATLDTILPLISTLMHGEVSADVVTRCPDHVFLIPRSPVFPP